MIKLSESLLAVVQVGQWERMLLDEGSEEALLPSAEAQASGKPQGNPRGPPGNPRGPPNSPSQLGRETQEVFALPPFAFRIEAPFNFGRLTPLVRRSGHVFLKLAPKPALN